MKKILFILLLLIIPITTHSQAMGQSRAEMLRQNPFRAVVSNIATSSATLSIEGMIYDEYLPEEKVQIYFEYIPSQQMCITVYPTPASCLPQVTKKGMMPVDIRDLKPGTSYRVTVKKDTNIQCIKAPCPTNEQVGTSIEFKTLPVTVDGTATPITITRNLYWGYHGEEVRILQSILMAKGFLKINNPGTYFGYGTYRAVQKFQASVGIMQSGHVGARTRLALGTLTLPISEGELFEGIIESSSTGCFSDGECSITISGKKIVTTVGWSREIVGSIRKSDGTILDLGAGQSTIGAHAKVYAEKTNSGYTLYGNKSYYIEIQ